MESNSDKCNSVVNSSSKYHQTEEVIKNMTERALGRSVKQMKVNELSGGMCNAVYLVETDGIKMVLKIASAPSADIMRHERDYLLIEADMLKLFEEKIDIPAPKLIYIDTSRQLCDAPYLFMSYMEGSSLLTMKERPNQEEISEIKRQVGIICSKISSIKADFFGIPRMPETYTDNNCDFMLTLFRMLLKDASDKQIEIPDLSPKELLTLIESFRDELNEADAPCVIHTDTWDGNLLIKNNKLLGLVDYAAVLFGDPLMNHDFHDFGGPSRDFMRGYGKTEFNLKEQVRIIIYKLWQRLGMIIERGFRNYEDNNMYAWVLGEFSRELINLKNML